MKVAIEGAGEGSMMDAVKLALVGVALLLAGGAAVAFGVLPVADALAIADRVWPCLLYTSPSPRDRTRSRMPSSA